MTRQVSQFLSTIVLCLMISGCGDVTLGPRVKTEYVIVRPGNPIEILQNVKVTGRRLKDETIGQVDIGGWIAMPVEHFEALKRALEEKDKHD